MSHRDRCQLVQSGQHESQLGELSMGADGSGPTVTGSNLIGVDRVLFLFQEPLSKSGLLGHKGIGLGTSDTTKNHHAE